jgi:hypothetical protein
MSAPTLVGATARRLGGRFVDATSAAPLLLAPPVAYLAVLTAAAWWARWRGRTTTAVAGSPATRFAVLVPAHDEEQLIGETVERLLALDYPPDLVQVHVVADHCTDRTVEIARATGAIVHEHEDPEPAGKGPALQWLVGELQRTGAEYDVAVIVDADTLVAPSLLRVLDARCAAGATVVQAHYAVRDQEQSTSTALRAAALSLRHYLRPLGRTALGASCGLYGNGMAFSREVLEGRHWSDHLTEDLELQSELVLDGVVVDFAPDAVVEAEMPTSLGASTSQHQRWERGRIDLARRYVPRLIRRAGQVRGRHRLALLDTAADHLVPPLSVLATGVAATTGWSGLAHAVRRSATTRRSWLVSLALVALLVAHVLSGLRMVRAPRAVYAALLRAPGAVAWKVRLWVRMIVRPEAATWQRTTRNAEQGAT